MHIIYLNRQNRKTRGGSLIRDWVLTPYPSYACSNPPRFFSTQRLSLTLVDKDGIHDIPTPILLAKLGAAGESWILCEAKLGMVWSASSVPLYSSQPR